jgi:hypothetical protein
LFYKVRLLASSATTIQEDQELSFSWPLYPLPKLPYQELATPAASLSKRSGQANLAEGYY